MDKRGSIVFGEDAARQRPLMPANMPARVHSLRHGMDLDMHATAVCSRVCKLCSSLKSGILCHSG